jgi:hypothetical protein
MSGVESKAATKVRLQADGRWRAAVRFREGLRKQGVSPAEAHARMVAAFPPPASDRQATTASDPPMMPADAPAPASEAHANGPSHKPQSKRAGRSAALPRGKLHAAWLAHLHGGGKSRRFRSIPIWPRRCKCCDEASAIRQNHPGYLAHARPRRPSRGAPSSRRTTACLSVRRAAGPSHTPARPQPASCAFASPGAARRKVERETREETGGGRTGKACADCWSRSHPATQHRANGCVGSACRHGTRRTAVGGTARGRLARVLRGNGLGWPPWQRRTGDS